MTQPWQEFKLKPALLLSFFSSYRQPAESNGTRMNPRIRQIYYFDLNVCLLELLDKLVVARHFNKP
jgi:hypothetical protein